MHAYQGLGGTPEGVNTAVDAALFAGLYLAARRNLLGAILVHDLGNTLGLNAIYFGWFRLLN